MSRSNRPNVLIYLVDTLRRDHLGIYGSKQTATPHIDAFAGSSVIFDQCYSPAPRTQPAVVSLVSGLEPQEHEVLRAGDSLDVAIPTLAELLQQAGYRTTAYVGNPYAGRRH